jgi:hypothetical protein
MRKLIKRTLVGGSCLLVTVSAYAGGQQANAPPPAVRQQMRERIQAQREQQMMIERRKREIQRQAQARAEEYKASLAAEQEKNPPEKPKPVYPTTKVLSSSPSAAQRPSGSTPSARPAPSGAVDPAFADVIKRFDQSSELWPQIDDIRTKTQIVSYYIDLYSQYNIQIRKPAMYYVNIINGMAAQSRQLLAQPMDQLLRMAAIIEYDYNDGQNKDDLALEVLGSPAAVAKNRSRLGLK